MFSATQGTYNLTNPASLIGGSILFAVVAALACVVPVRRAMCVDPVPSRCATNEGLVSRRLSVNTSRLLLESLVAQWGRSFH